jgi:hypothetical protein
MASTSAAASSSRSQGIPRALTSAVPDLNDMVSYDKGHNLRRLPTEPNLHQFNYVFKQEMPTWTNDDKVTLLAHSLTEAERQFMDNALGVTTGKIIFGAVDKLQQDVENHVRAETNNILDWVDKVVAHISNRVGSEAVNPLIDMRRIVEEQTREL